MGQGPPGNIQLQQQEELVASLQKALDSCESDETMAALLRPSVQAAQAKLETLRQAPASPTPPVPEGPTKLSDLQRRYTYKITKARWEVHRKQRLLEEKQQQLQEIQAEVEDLKGKVHTAQERVRAIEATAPPTCADERGLPVTPSLAARSVGHD